MYNLIALVGKAGSGKDTILNAVVADTVDVNPVISYTTRPPREGERDGVDYHFIEPEEFLHKVNNGEMFEYTNFNGWYYGTGTESLKEDRYNIGVFNPAGIITLLQNKNINLTIYEIFCSNKERLLRQLNRENDPDVDEIVRRYETDQEDFARFVFKERELAKQGFEAEHHYVANHTKGEFSLGVNRILDKIHSLY